MRSHVLGGLADKLASHPSHASRPGRWCQGGRIQLARRGAVAAAVVRSQVVGGLADMLAHGDGLVGRQE